MYCASAISTCTSNVDARRHVGARDGAVLVHDEAATAAIHKVDLEVVRSVVRVELREHRVGSTAATVIIEPPRETRSIGSIGLRASTTDPSLSTDQREGICAVDAREAHLERGDEAVHDGVERNRDPVEDALDHAALEPGRYQLAQRVAEGDELAHNCASPGAT
jgi:hypothetical protein